MNISDRIAHANFGFREIVAEIWRAILHQANLIKRLQRENVEITQRVETLEKTLDMVVLNWHESVEVAKLATEQAV